MARQLLYTCSYSNVSRSLAHAMLTCIKLWASRTHPFIKILSLNIYLMDQPAYLWLINYLWEKGCCNHLAFFCLSIHLFTGNSGHIWVQSTTPPDDRRSDCCCTYITAVILKEGKFNIMKAELERKLNEAISPRG